MIIQYKAPTLQKLQRNQVYKACGYSMSSCILLIANYSILPDTVVLSLEKYYLVFWLEMFAIVAFGVSWLTNGKAIVQDIVIS